ncbi:MAG TPA: glycosyltransferase [Roseiflexaceae bacterium]|mgnify:CR=1 FL=1|nr:glycosyltransferase [Roseiflexaceae bacterium]HMP39054.1 glycosyltransferase [Roseiflexaceae bacterium]
MQLTIAVCTRNRPAQIRRCLEHLARADCSAVHEILVIDQSDTPLRPADLPQLEQLRLVPTASRGLSRARNLAVRLMRGTAIAFTDDDCYVDRQWPAAIARTMADDPQLDALFGRVLAYGTAEQITHHHVRTPFGVITYASHTDGRQCSGLIDAAQPAIYTTPVPPFEHLGAGNNMTFHRRVFEQHGLFIEMLGVGSTLRSGEDTEMQLRLLRAGCRLRYDPAATIFHDGWVTAEQNMRLQNGYACGVLAVLLRFALRGDPLARMLLHFRFRSIEQEISTSVQQAAERKPLSYYRERFVALVSGALGGVYLAQRADSAIPHLNSTQHLS